MITFYTEDGIFELSYADYIKDFKATGVESDLMVKVKDPLRANLYLGKTILSYDRKYLKDHDQQREIFQTLEKMQFDNPLRFFCPSGEQQLAFLNDLEASLKGVIAPNRAGKTTIAYINLLLDIIPTDPKWEIFTKHGVRWRPFAPPDDGWVCAIASYEWLNHKNTIWPQVVKKWTPKTLIKDYLPELGGKKVINWKDNPSIKSDFFEMWFLTYSQNQTPYESQAVARFLWDEQGEEVKFDGADERARTVNGKHTFSLTPHKVDGRPDTGAGSWIHDLAQGTKTKGHICRFYKCDLMEDVPDWIYSETQKKMAYHKWVVEPTETGNIKALREGRARLYGEWHESGGLVYDEWNYAVHVIDDFKIPKAWTKYRAIDWGRVNPTSCLWFAVDEKGTVFLYREFLEVNSIISDSVKKIIELSGNKRRRVDTFTDGRTGKMFERHREVECGEKFVKTVLDGRTYKMSDPSSGMTISDFFRAEGLQVSPASGKNTYETVPIVKEWLNPDYSQKNPYNNCMGRSQVYVFRSCSNFIRNIQHYTNKDTARKIDGKAILAERPIEKNDHDMDAFRYAIQIPMIFHEGVGLETEDEMIDNYKNSHTMRKVRDSYTGY